MDVSFEGSLEHVLRLLVDYLCSARMPLWTVDTVQSAFIRLLKKIQCVANLHLSPLKTPCVMLASSYDKYFLSSYQIRFSLSLSLVCSVFFIPLSLP